VLNFELSLNEINNVRNAVGWLKCYRSRSAGVASLRVMKTLRNEVPWLGDFHTRNADTHQ